MPAKTNGSTKKPPQKPPPAKMQLIKQPRAPVAQLAPVVQPHRARVMTALSAPLMRENAGVKQLVMAAVLPSDFKQVRIPSQTPQKTAVADLELDELVEVQVDSGASGPIFNPTNRTAFVQTGQPGVPWLIQRHVESIWVGNALRSTAGSNVRYAIPVGELSIQRMIPVDYFAGFVSFTNNALETSTDSRTMPTVSGNWTGASYTCRKHACYMPCSFTPVLNVRSGLGWAGVGTVVTVNTEIWQFEADGEVRTSTAVAFALPALGAGIDVSMAPTTPPRLPPGYYQFGVNNIISTNATGSDIVLSIAAQWNNQALQTLIPTLLPLTPPGLSDSGAYNSTRATACAALCSNVTRVLDLEGTVHGARLDYDNYIPDFAENSLYETATTTVATKRYYGALSTGIYTFSPYITENLNFGNYVYHTTSHFPTRGANPAPGTADFLLTQGTAIPGVVPVLYSMSTPFNIMYFNDNSGGSQMALRLELHLEYLTDSQFLNTGTTILSLTDLFHAQQLMSAIPYFYENPFHWRMVKDALNNAWKRIKPWAPKLLEGAGAGATALFPELGPIPAFIAGAAARAVR